MTITEGLKRISVGGEIQYVKYSTAKAGDVLVVGTFEGTKLVPAYKARNGETTKVHLFTTEEGKKVQLPSAGQLNWKLTDVEPGTLLEVVFLGKEEYKDKRTGKMELANQFEVYALEIEG